MNGPEEGAQSVPDGLSEAVRRWPEHAEEIAQYAETAGVMRRFMRLIRVQQERITELEDELGADVDGICTGMHADVAEAHAEVERLRAVLAELDSRLSWHTTCKTCARILDSAIEETERDEYRRLHAHASDLYEMFRRLYDDEADRSDRYRTAWLSARRRAALESVYATEALALMDAEIADLRADLEDTRKPTCA